ncbi:MAG TPA: tRNA (adenosine(37)-N6)-threonylcarbamoyltransferase complex ATPase subunit type 1 TsaE [Firmicutes bacterium]|nr:tRNA (adenosine(37)-N6)-threonylcarbamoyltransferase complex ATPase subunit type 1 TsaE [Bacillota bacterium]
MKQVFTSHSPEETLDLGESLARELPAGAIVLLYGDLGAGKSVFARGIARFYGIPEKEVRSPTFTLLNIHISLRGAVNHFDLYRIGDSEELFQLGFDEHLEEGAVTIIEWAEKAEIPPDSYAVKVTITLLDENTRKITIER